MYRVDSIDIYVAGNIPPKALFDMMLIQGMTIVGDGLHERDCGHHGALAASPVEDGHHALERTKILACWVVNVAEATRKLRPPEK